MPLAPWTFDWTPANCLNAHGFSCSCRGRSPSGSKAVSTAMPLFHPIHAPLGSGRWVRLTQVKGHEVGALDGTLLDLGRMFHSHASSDYTSRLNSHALPFP